MNQNKIERAREGVTCTCLRTPEQLKLKGHVMGCDLRSREAAITYYEYTQSLDRIQRQLENFP